MLACIGIGASETFTKLHYGDPDYVWLFEGILDAFPS